MDVKTIEIKNITENEFTFQPNERKMYNKKKQMIDARITRDFTITYFTTKKNCSLITEMNCFIGILTNKNSL